MHSVPVPALAFLLLLFTGQVLSGCPTGWTQLVQSNKCVAAFGEQLIFLDAMQYCQNIAPGNGGSLVSIHNAFQNAQLAALGQQTSLGCPFWIGLYDFDGSDQYTWIDQTVLDYTDWASGYPTQSTEETAAFMNPNLKNRWEDTNELFTKTCFFCQQNINQPTTAPATTTTTREKDCREGWSRFGDSCYQFFQTKMVFNDALAHCVAENAHLATLETQDELRFARDLVNSTSSAFYPWIGLTKSNGAWKWIDGEPVSEDSWCDREPSSCCGAGEYACGIIVNDNLPKNDCVGDHGCLTQLMPLCEYQV